MERVQTEAERRVGMTADITELPAGIMPDYRREIPPELRQRQGSWVWHELVRPGVLRHLGADGGELFTVRILLPPNGILSAPTLRQLAHWIRKYALTGRRTSRQGFEFVGVQPAVLGEMLAELQAAGFPAGGTGNTLHQVKCCTSFIHCQNAAIDAPSIAQVITDYFYDDFLHPELPAALKISVSGCPNQCGGGVEADIGIMGRYESIPEVDEEGFLNANIDIGLLLSWCPTGAIQPRETARGTLVTIDAGRCARCTSCVQVAPEGIKLQQRSYAAIAVGGHGGNSRYGSEMATVVWPRVTAQPLQYGQLLERIAAIINYWRRVGIPGERLAACLQRTGWEEFLAGVGAEPFAEPGTGRRAVANKRKGIEAGQL
jgi:sulfite reductase beta subunit